MKISIQRPEQIGGQITRITTDEASIIIDLGHNLPSDNGGGDPLDNPEAIAEITAGCNAVLYTHSHGDHVGLAHLVPESVPQYIGQAAKAIMICQNDYMARRTARHEDSATEYRQKKVIAERMIPYQVMDDRLRFGDIRVTPYLVSHSAYDAYMFLIEAEGKRILHTGDFRSHGFLSKGLPSVLRRVGQVDVLITEGTMISRSDEQVLTEKELAAKAEDLIRGHKYTFVLCSSTDLERIAAFYNVTKDIGDRRLFVVNDHQSKILDVFNDYAGTWTNCFKFDPDHLFVYYGRPEKATRKLVNDGFTAIIKASGEWNRWLTDFFSRIDPADTLFIYSAWPGYLNYPETTIDGYKKLYERFKAFKADCVELHTAGHATPEALLQVCESTNPRMAIIPVHREPDSDYRAIDISPDLCSKVVTSACSLPGIDISFNDFHPSEK